MGLNLNYNILNSIHDSILQFSESLFSHGHEEDEGILLIKKNASLELGDNKVIQDYYEGEVIKIKNHEAWEDYSTKALEVRMSEYIEYWINFPEDEELKALIVFLEDENSKITNARSYFGFQQNGKNDIRILVEAALDKETRTFKIAIPLNIYVGSPQWSKLLEFFEITESSRIVALSISMAISNYVYLRRMEGRLTYLKHLINGEADRSPQVKVERGQQGLKNEQFINNSAVANTFELVHDKGIEILDPIYKALTNDKDPAIENCSIEKFRLAFSNSRVDQNLMIEWKKGRVRLAYFIHQLFEYGIIPDDEPYNALIQNNRIFVIGGKTVQNIKTEYSGIYKGGAIPRNVKFIDDAFKGLQ